MYIYPHMCIMCVYPQLSSGENSFMYLRVKQKPSQRGKKPNEKLLDTSVLYKFFSLSSLILKYDHVYVW